MRELGDDARFPIEALAELWIAGEALRQDFDRHRAIEARVTGSVDLAHPPCAKRAEDFIRAESGAGGKCHACLSLLGIPGEP